MLRQRKRTILILCGCVLLNGSSWALCSEPESISDERPQPPTELRHTRLAPVLEGKIREGENLFWCATFQLAWNELATLCGGKVHLAGAPPIAAQLNEMVVTSEALSADHHFAVSGIIGQGVLRQARRELEQRPGLDAADAMLLRRIEETTAPWSLICYAFYQRQMPFENAFPILDRGVQFGAAAVEDDDGDAIASVKYKAFGMESYKPGGNQDRLAEQVRVLWHEAQQADDHVPCNQFVIELVTKAKEVRLFLAVIEPAATLRQTVEQVQQHVESPNELTAAEWQAMLDDSYEKAMASRSQVRDLINRDVVRIPLVDLHLLSHHKKVEGKVVLNLPDLPPTPVVHALQRVKFWLGPSGAELASEASLSIFGMPPREFVFDRPFLVLVTNRESGKPVLAGWIGHSELFVPAPPRAASQGPRDSIFDD